MPLTTAPLTLLVFFFINTSVLLIVKNGINGYSVAQIKRKIRVQVFFFYLIGRYEVILYRYPLCPMWGNVLLAAAGALFINAKYLLNEWELIPTWRKVIIACSMRPFPINADLFQSCS